MEGLIGISDHSNWHDFDFRIKKKSFEIGSRNVGCCRHWAPCACRRVGLSGKQVLILLFIRGTIPRLYICQIQISHRCSGPRRLCSILEGSLVHIESSAYRHPSCVLQYVLIDRSEVWHQWIGVCRKLEKAYW